MQLGTSHQIRALLAARRKDGGTIEVTAEWADDDDEDDSDAQLAWAVNLSLLGKYLTSAPELTDNPFRPLPVRHAAMPCRYDVR